MSKIKPTCLLIAPSFFGYAKEIQSALLRRGVVSTWFCDRPSDNTISKIFIRLLPRMQKESADTYFNSMIEQVKDHPIDEVLVIKGTSLSVESIKRLKIAFPHARFTLYFWDSYKNMPSESRAKVSLFDNAFTFDPVDAQQDVRLAYRPLFYINEYANLPDVKEDIDIFFFGTVHSDRYKVLRQLEKSLPAGLHIKKILYFPSRLVYWGRRIFDPSFWRAEYSEFVFTPVAKAELQQLLARSRIVLDIERPIQSGLTMRTIETLGAQKKLITTNPFASNCELYTPENILVIDRMNISVPTAFLHTEFTPPSADLTTKYSIDGWLTEVLPERKMLLVSTKKRA